MGSSPAVTLIRREIPGFCQPHSVILCGSLLAGRPGSPCVPLSRAQGSRRAWLRGQHGPLCDPFGFGSGARFLISPCLAAGPHRGDGLGHFSLEVLSLSSPVAHVADDSHLPGSVLWVLWV